LISYSNTVMLATRRANDQVNNEHTITNEKSAQRDANTLRWL